MILITKAFVCVCVCVCVPIALSLLVQPGIAGQGKLFPPVPVRASEFGVSRHVRLSFSTTVRSLSAPRLNLGLTHLLSAFFRLSSVTMSIHTIKYYLVILELIRSRSRVSVIFTAGSPPETGQ